MDFFAEGVRDSATLAATTAQRLVARGKEDRARLGALGRLAGSALRVHHAFMERPVANVNQLVSRAQLSAPAVLKALSALQRLDLVAEMTGRRRNRVYSYAPYLAILSEGTQPLD